MQIHIHTHIYVCIPFKLDSDTFNAPIESLTKGEKIHAFHRFCQVTSFFFVFFLFEWDQNTSYQRSAQLTTGDRIHPCCSVGSGTRWRPRTWWWGPAASWGTEAGGSATSAWVPATTSPSSSSHWCMATASPEGVAVVPEGHVCFLTNRTFT